MKKRNYRSAVLFLRFKLIFLLLSLFLWGNLTAQYQQFMHKPHAERISEMQDLYRTIIALEDSVAISKKTEEIKSFARKNKDKEMEMEMDLLMAYHNIQFKKHRSGKCISDLKLIISKADKEGITHIKIRAIRVLADYYWHTVKNYELAFEQYLLQEKEIDKVSASEYPEKPRDLAEIGMAYYFFQDYDMAKKYFEKAISVPENDFNTMFINSARNTLGLCYQKEKNYKRSDYYFNQIIQTKFAKPQMEWVHIAKGNIGTNHYLQKEYDKALPLLEYDYKESAKTQDYGPAAGAAILLGDIFIAKNDKQLAWYYIRHAREFIEKAEQNDRLLHWYPVISKWHNVYGDKKEAQKYLDSTVNAINSYHAKFNAIKALRAQQKVNLQETELREATLALEKQKRINERYILIIILISLGIVAVSGYYIHKKRQQAALIEKLKIEGELKKAQSEINLFIYKINEQSKITEKLYNELKILKDSGSEERKLLEKTVADLRITKILTDEDWITFQIHFGKIFPNFIQNLKSNYPAVTNAEIRYLMLSKLRLSHKEMSQALGVSSDTIRVTWNRVRKKLGGTLEDTPLSLVEKLG